MQLFLEFRGSNINLPIAYRYAQQGMIYRALSADGDFATQLHDVGHVVDDRSFKLFTFSPLSGPYSIQNKRIIFHEWMSMEVRSVDDRFIHQLAEQIREGALVTIGQQLLRVTRSRVADEHLHRSNADIETISPLVVYRTMEDGHTHFLSPEDEGFCPALVRNAQRKWQSLHGAAAPFSLEIQPLTGMHPRKVVTNFKHTFITGWHGRFRLIGAPEVLDMLYQTGLGTKSSQGFGMFGTNFIRQPQ